MIKGNIFNIQRFSIHDGPGIRTTVFMKGCNLRCWWCHNPESWNKEQSIGFNSRNCIGCGACLKACPNICHVIEKGHRKFKREKCIACGKCVDSCCTNALTLCGKIMTPSEVFDEVKKDIMFYNNSNGGVTFSGGECMLQIDFLYECLKICKENKINTAIDTAACVPFKFFKRIMPYSDLFLVDLKCIDEEKHIEGTGVSNKLILNNIASLLNSFPQKVYIRIPVIPYFNANDSEFYRIANFLKQYPQCLGIELMPYHKLGVNKRTQFGLRAQKYNPELVSEEDIRRYKEILNYK